MSSLEEMLCCGIKLQLPADVCHDYQLLAELISPETWNHCLTDDNREELMNLLPTFPENDLEEKTHTLEMFFMDVNFRYGTPLRRFHHQLQSGHFNPTIARHRANREAVQRKLRRYEYRDHLHHTLEDTIIRRQQYIELANSLPPDTVPHPLAHLSLTLSLNKHAVNGSLHEPTSFNNQSLLGSSFKTAHLNEHSLHISSLNNSSYQGTSINNASQKQSLHLTSVNNTSLKISLHASGSFLHDMAAATSFPRVAHPWRATVEHRTKRRYYRELQAMRAEAGVAAGDLSDDDDSYTDECGPPASKKQRKQLCIAEGSLPTNLLPIRHTHSTGSLAKDLELLLTRDYNPIDLTDTNLEAIICTHANSKRTRRKAGEVSITQDIRGIKLSDVISRASQNNKRPLTLLPPPAPPPPPVALPTPATRNNDNRLYHRTRAKKDRSNGTSGSVPGELFSGENLCQQHIKVEEDADDMMEGDDQDRELPPLARYVTIGSGVVIKSELPDETSTHAREEFLEKKTARAPAQSTAKRRLLSQSSKSSIKTDITEGVFNSSPNCAVNGSIVIKQEVKEEPVDDGLQQQQHGSSNCPVADTVLVSRNKEGSHITGVSSVMSVGVLQQPHACFFCLLREIICQPKEQRLSRGQLECSVRAWQQSSVAQQVNVWHSELQSGTWLQALPSAINFLAGFTADAQPLDLVPYLEYKTLLQAYQWIGAGRDSDAKLQQLYNFWIANRCSMSNCWMVSWSSVNGSSNGATTDGQQSVAGDETPHDGIDEEGLLEESIPAPRCPSSWTVQPASAEERHQYRQQEKLRYEKPHKAFTYRVHGYESVVGPVKGIYSQHSGPNKARGHSLLTPNRPAYVTILALVRDAVARLPNGEGTRAEICELLRESQYLAPLHNATAESALNSVVSGALDRLHYEQDPCVKYLANRKMWIYLHRNRDEQEFERMHHLNGPGCNKNKKAAARRHPRPSKLSSKESCKAPPNVAIHPHNTSVKVEGGQVKMRPEDVLVKHNSSNKVFLNTSNSIVNDKNSAAAAPSHTTILTGVLPLVSPSSSPAVSSAIVATTTTTSSTANNMPPSATSAPNTSGGTAQSVGSVISVAGIGSGPAAGSMSSLPETQGSTLVKTSLVTSPSTAAAAAANRTITTVKVPSSTVRTLMSSSLQTIQVSTASGIQTIKVALPSSAAAQHFAKGTLLGRIAGAAVPGGVVAINSRGGKKQQPIGQIIQTSSGPQFITTGISSSGSTVGQLVAASRRVATQEQQHRLQQPVILSTSSAVNSLAVSGHTGAVSVVVSAAAAGVVRPLLSQSNNINSSSTAAVLQGANQSPSTTVQQQMLVSNLATKTASANKSSTNGISAAVVSYSVGNRISNSNTNTLSNRNGSNRNIISNNATISSVICGVSRSISNNNNSSGGDVIVNKGSSSSPLSSPSSSSSAAAAVATLLQSGSRMQAITAHQLSGLKLLHTPVPANQLHQSLLGGSVVGQKFVVSGNKLMLQQGGKVIPAGVQQLVAVQQQKGISATGGGSNTAGLQRLTLVSSPGSSLTGANTAVQQPVLLGAQTSTASAAQSSGSSSSLISVGGKQVLLTAKHGVTALQQQALQGQVVLAGAKLGQVIIGGEKISGQMVASIGGQQLVLSAQPAGSGQQLVLPASALQGGQISIKGLQAFHTLKVIPSGGGLLSPAGKNKPVLARMVQQQQQTRVRAPTSLIVSASAAPLPLLTPSQTSNCTVPTTINTNLSNHASNSPADNPRLNNINLVNNNNNNSKNNNS
uniref:Nuclear factor related to kappa-B-binding protein-like n=3 Tax=Hirondellea gigas TaxID=1518452 RepID=A0A6A7FQJ2_9CRUS